jgi:hypothetical protein
MDASCRWHRGAPPPGWCQAGNGRWHPPASEDATDELMTGSPVGGAHLAGGGWGTDVWRTYRSWPRWARLAAPILALILVLGLLGAAATERLREDGRETTATSRVTTTTQAETAATLPDVVTPAPSVGASTATASVPSGNAPAEPEATPTTVGADPAPDPPTPADPPTNDIHPGAPCSPEGATTVMGDGTPMVCTTQKCHGAPFSQPRWRRAGC